LPTPPARPPAAHPEANASWASRRLEALSEKYPFTLDCIDHPLPEPFSWEVSSCQSVYSELCNKKHIGRITALAIFLDHNQESFFLLGSNRGATIAFYLSRWILFSDGDFRKV
jgi:hypothetical protein